MKLRMEQTDVDEEEVIIRYRDRNSRIDAIAEFVDRIGREEEAAQRVTALWEGQMVFLELKDIYYLETVDGITYAYLKNRVVKISGRLKNWELLYGNRGFFRCSKSMVLNIRKIEYLKSEPGSRIRATLENGEQVIISRKYGKELRRILKGGNRDEG